MHTDRATFLGVEACDLTTTLPAADVILFGASDATPYVVGQTSHAAKAPDFIRRALSHYESDLTRWDFDQEAELLAPTKLRVLDGGNLVTDPTTPESNRDVIRTTTQAVLSAGAIPILLGGDDSVPIPFFEAFRKSKGLTILQIDAHLDWRDQRNGSGYTFSSTMRRASELPWVRRIVQVGLRGIGGSGRTEYDYAKAWGAKIVTARDLRLHGIASVLEEIEDDSECLITIDCDGLDPSVIPGVLIPQPGGLSYFEVVDLMRGVASKCRIVGLDIVEFVPERDVQNLGAIAVSRILCNGLGCIRKRAV
ncbi:arginase family protein [Bradyrhizobium sp. CCGB20]|uniref:arginase family protein n=1 Tax=Bradyrhizobium sp. CCGB20 TaxID=2949633 RepID=UPI0020B3AE57|nr:arginase family protein [Bradyrhizobium sp. CCGB20]MCP3401920.1 arginase family protein [Bradyrhizobium sp. CCGB20]